MIKPGWQDIPGNTWLWERLKEVGGKIPIEVIEIDRRAVGDGRRLRAS